MRSIAGHHTRKHAMPVVPTITPYTSLFGFIVGLPTLAATYYQAWKTRQESREARQGLLYSENCLDFILEDGTSINLVPLETLHSLPKPGDIVLLPGNTHAAEQLVQQHCAYRINRIEHIYARVEGRYAHIGHARLAKAVAHVDALSSSSYEQLEQQTA